MRILSKSRKTKETDITLTLNLDGSGNSNITTGVPFFDHMLNQIAKHGGFDLDIVAKGDLEIDSHHLIEDTGIVFGTVLKELIANSNLERYGDTITPMDEALALVAIDLCNRGNFSCDDDYFTVAKIGDMETEMIYEFFKAIAYNACINIHILKLRGFNNHHIAEAIFKGFGRSLRIASRETSSLKSTKGVL